MKYILIKGSRSSGKSATAKAICKRLNPTSVKKLCFDDAGKTSLKVSALDEVEKDNYILTVKKRRILVVAGAPTGQRKKITDIMKAVREADVYPDLSIVACVVWRNYTILPPQKSFWSLGNVYTKQEYGAYRQTNSSIRKNGTQGYPI
jgi:hypothetical protein